MRTYQFKSIKLYDNWDEYSIIIDEDINAFQLAIINDIIRYSTPDWKSIADEYPELYKYIRK